MKPLTRKQREAILRLWNRDCAGDFSYLTFRRRFFQTHMDCVCGAVRGITFGIEPDGYTHT
jgi:hypothetical protein